ncbi:MAG: VCBS repeat-containing protein, partial [Verrucomicrobia bacterium]|nr:VCBS repeat-containing protein [Verrucomicrobiota bacterium]
MKQSVMRILVVNMLLLVATRSSAGTLSDGRVCPLNGNLSTPFRFSVVYTDPATNLPSAIQFVVDEGATNVMSEADATDTDTSDGKTYRWQGSLAAGRHFFRFASEPASGGDVLPHDGPVVSDVSLQFREFFHFLQCNADPSLESHPTEASSVVPAGDVNGDGEPDLMYGWCRATVLGNLDEGIAEVYFGPLFTNHVTLLHPDYPAGARFGDVVKAVGDVDGDGCDDVAVGSYDEHPLWDAEMFVYSGNTNETLQLLRRFSTGNDLAPVGGADMDGDGYSDVVAEELIDIENNGHPQCKVHVIFGPALSTDTVKNLGIFSPRGRAMADRNGDGYPDSVHSGLDIGEPSSSEEQVRAINGPGLGANTVVSRSSAWTHFVGLGDVNGDGNDDFAATASLIYFDPGQPSWYSGPDLTSPSAIPIPTSPSYTFQGHFGAGDMSGDGRPDYAAIEMTDADQYTGYVIPMWHEGSLPFQNHTNISSYWVWRQYDYKPHCGRLGDLGGNGLSDIFTSGPGSAVGPWGHSVGYSMGTVQVLEPYYPYPITATDLPAHYRGRMAGLKVNLLLWGTSPLTWNHMPNGMISIIAGPAEAGGRAPIIIPSESLFIPDHFGGDSGQVQGWRIRSTGQDGSGSIIMTGVNAGQVDLTMELDVSIVRVGSPEQILASDRIRLKFEADPPFDFATGYVVLKARGVNSHLFRVPGIPTTP